MPFKFKVSSVLCAIALLFCTQAYAHSLIAEYVSWGIDEYELLGLSKSELAQKFKDKLRYDSAFAHAWLRTDDRGPQFWLTYKDKCVCAVQRVFIDGAGCIIKGPVLNSKEEALMFTVTGLSSSNRDAQDEKRLQTAKQLLHKLQPSKGAK